MDTREQFIFLGFTNATHFFMHTLFDETVPSDHFIDMAGQVYNCMIHNTQILLGECVVVVHIVPKEKKYYLSHVTHIDFKQIIPDDKIVDQFNRIVNARAIDTKNDFFIIRGSINPDKKLGQMECYELPYNTLRSFAEYKNRTAFEPNKVAGIAHVVTKKPINYLS